MTLICIHCHTEQSVEAMIESAAGRDYMRLLLSQPPALQRALSAYVWLFRSAKRNLSYERRLKLAHEVLALAADPRALAAALSDTVESLRRKQDEGDSRPLTNHRYLLKVLEGVPLLAGEGGASPVSQGGWPQAGGVAQRRPSKSALADQILATWASDDDLRRVIAAGLQALLAMPLTLRPEPADIERVAALWERELAKNGVVSTAEDAARVRVGFSGLLSATTGKFPEPSTLIQHLPRRQAQQRLQTPQEELTDPDAVQRIIREGLERLEGK